jgi:hypothetical protein
MMQQTKTKRKRPLFPARVKTAVRQRTGNRCERCGRDFAEGDGEPHGEFHHIIPVYCGGTESIDNCSLLCYSCHRAAPDIKVRYERVMYDLYFLRFASFKEAAQFYGVTNRFDLMVELIKDPTIRKALELELLNATGEQRHKT